MTKTIRLFQEYKKTRRELDLAEEQRDECGVKMDKLFKSFHSKRVEHEKCSRQHSDLLNKLLEVNKKFEDAREKLLGVRFIQVSTEPEIDSAFHFRQETNWNGKIIAALSLDQTAQRVLDGYALQHYDVHIMADIQDLDQLDQVEVNQP